MSAPAVNSVYYNRSGASVRLGAELGRGGEGYIFELPALPGRVAKLYRPEKLSDPMERSRREGKLLAMIANPVKLDSGGTGVPLITWPEVALYNGGGEFCGFVMPRVNSRHHLEVLYQSTTRRRLLPGLTWKGLVAIAFNLAFALDAIHEAGHVIGDFNDQNVLISDKGLVTIIDTDSFDIRAADGSHYPCAVGMAQYIAPELQGRDLREGEFTVQTDRFALAVHIFRLLMDGHHPFHCGKTGDSGSEATSPIQPNIKGGFCAYTRKLRGYSLPPSAPDYHRSIPQPLQTLFARAFNYSKSDFAARKRPTAYEWETALNSLYSGGDIVVCVSDKRHEYCKSCGSCPWCEAERKYREARERAQRAVKRRAPLEATIKTRIRPKQQSRRKDGKVLRAWPLYAFSMLVGLLFWPVALHYHGAAVSAAVERLLAAHIPPALLALELSVIGAVVGWFFAYLAAPSYRGSPAAARWFPLAVVIAPSGALACVLVFGFAMTSPLLFIGILAACGIVLAAFQNHR